MAPDGRPNQKLRTRKALLQAAARLLKRGGRPSLEEIAEEALVSRATAYRYFPNVEALLVESSLDIAVPEADELFADGGPADPAARVERVDAMLHDAVLANDAAFRTMLVNSLEHRARGDGSLPPRQNRRTPLIAAALAPTRDAFEPAALDRLTKALALIVGTEAMVVIQDVLQLDDAEARRVKAWAIRALVDAARRGRAEP